MPYPTVKRILISRSMQTVITQFKLMIFRNDFFIRNTSRTSTSSTENTEMWCSVFTAKAYILLNHTHGQCCFQPDELCNSVTFEFPSEDFLTHARALALPSLGWITLPMCIFWRSIKLHLCTFYCLDIRMCHTPCVRVWFCVYNWLLERDTKLKSS